MLEDEIWCVVLFELLFSEEFFDVDDDDSDVVSSFDLESSLSDGEVIVVFIDFKRCSDFIVNDDYVRYVCDNI